MLQNSYNEAVQVAQLLGQCEDGDAAKREAVSLHKQLVEKRKQILAVINAVAPVPAPP